VCCTCVTLTCFRGSTVQPQVQPHGGHDVIGSCAGVSTVDRCLVGSLPDARGCAEPPHLVGVACMWNTSHEPYTHHSTQSQKVQRATLSASARQQQQRHVCCTCVTLTWRRSTMHPQVQPDGGHDVTESCAGASTVGRCAVGSLPDERGCGEPPHLGGAACMRHASHEAYTHHSTHSHSRCKEPHSLPQHGNSSSATCVAHASPSPVSVHPPCTHRSSPTEVMT
jgi:hypothetical protein